MRLLSLKHLKGSNDVFDLGKHSAAACTATGFVEVHIKNITTAIQPTNTLTV